MAKQDSRDLLAKTTAFISERDYSNLLPLTNSNQIKIFKKRILSRSQTIRFHRSWTSMSQSVGKQCGQVRNRHSEFVPLVYLTVHWRSHISRARVRPHAEMKGERIRQWKVTSCPSLTPLVPLTKYANRSKWTSDDVYPPNTEKLPPSSQSGNKAGASSFHCFLPVIFVLTDKI